MLSKLVGVVSLSHIELKITIKMGIAKFALMAVDRKIMFQFSSCTLCGSFAKYIATKVVHLGIRVIFCIWSV